jgi:hypothetical protein
MRVRLAGSSVMLPSLPSSLTGCRDRLNSSAALFMAVPASQYPPALHKTLSEANRQVPLLPTATLPALGLHKRSVCCSAARGVGACYTPLMHQARLIAALQDALTKHFWPEYPVIGGAVTARCHCGASIRTAEAWLEHLKTDVIPETVRANSAEMG